MGGSDGIAIERRTSVAAVHTWVVRISMKSTNLSKVSIRKVCPPKMSTKQVHTPCEGLALQLGVRVDGGGGGTVAERVLIMCARFVSDLKLDLRAVPLARSSTR